MRFGISFGSSSGFSFNASHGNNRGLGNWQNPPPPKPPERYFEQPSNGLKVFTPPATPAPQATSPANVQSIAQRLSSDVYSPAFSSSAVLTKPTVIYGSTWGNADADYYGKLVAANRRPEAYSYMEQRLRDENTMKVAKVSTPTAAVEHAGRPASAIAFDTIWHTVWTEEKGKHYSDLIKAGKREEAGNYIGKYAHDVEAQVAKSASLALTKPTVVYGSAWGNADADYYGKLVAADRRPEACSYMEQRLRDENTMKVAKVSTPTAAVGHAGRPASAIAFDKIWHTVWTEEKGKHYSDLIKAGKREEAGNYIGKYAHDVEAQVAKSATPTVIPPVVPAPVSSGSSSCGSSSISSSSASSNSSSSSYVNLAAEHAALLAARASQNKLPIHSDCIISEEAKDIKRTVLTITGLTFDAMNGRDIDHLAIAHRSLQAMAQVEKDVAKDQMSCTLGKAEQSFIDKVIEVTELVKEPEIASKKRSCSPSPRL
jgi:dUTPase